MEYHYGASLGKILNYWKSDSKFPKYTKGLATHYVVWDSYK